jgi:UDP-N-acetylmuramoylalanine--D-glutamate ligase
VLGEHRSADFERADVVIANPAVRPDDPLLAAARATGAEITSEIELFLEAVRAPVVAVTGTQGKSSTCHLTHGLIARCGRRAHLGGNIGASLLPRLPEILPEDVVVLELSSYQLEALHAGRRAARATAVAIVNILQDHLERHETVERYAAAKLRILELLAPDGTAILPADDARFRARRGPFRTRFFSAQDRAADPPHRRGSVLPRERESRARVGPRVARNLPARERARGSGARAPRGRRARGAGGRAAAPARARAPARGPRDGARQAS